MSSGDSFTAWDSSADTSSIYSTASFTDTNTGLSHAVTTHEFGHNQYSDTEQGTDTGDPSAVTATVDDSSQSSYSLHDAQSGGGTSDRKRVLVRARTDSHLCNEKTATCDHKN